MALPEWYVNTKDVLADIWHNAGTKLIGYIITVIGILGALDAGTINEVQAWLGPKYGPEFGPVCLICAGLVVRMRGSRNTADIADHIINRANAGDPSASAVVARATTNAVASSDKVLLVNTPTPPVKPASTEIPK